jgi:hypothetical protein
LAHPQAAIPDRRLRVLAVRHVSRNSIDRLAARGASAAPHKRRPILSGYLAESAPISRGNIGRRGVNFLYHFSVIARFDPWIQNPAVGGSTPPLATI